MRKMILIILIVLPFLFLGGVAYCESDAEIASKVDSYISDIYAYHLALYNLHSKYGKIDFRTDEFKKIKPIKAAVSDEAGRQKIESINKYISDNFSIWKKGLRNEKAPLKLISEIHSIESLVVFRTYKDYIDIKDAQNGGFFALTSYQKRFEDLLKESQKSKACFISRFPFSDSHKLILIFKDIEKINEDGTVMFKFKSPTVKVTCEFASLEKEFVYEIVIDGYKAKEYRKALIDRLAEQNKRGEITDANFQSILKELGPNGFVYKCDTDKDSCIFPAHLVELLNLGIAKEIEKWIVKEMSFRGLLSKDIPRQ